MLCPERIVYAVQVFGQGFGQDARAYSHCFLDQTHGLDVVLAGKLSRGQFEIGYHLLGQI